MYQERNVSLSQFGIALLILFLVMRYVPYGREIGIGILILSLITTNRIGTGIAGLFSLVDQAAAFRLPPQSSSDQIPPFIPTQIVPFFP